MKKKTAFIVIGLIVIFMFAGLVAPLMSKEQGNNNTPSNTENNASGDTDYNVDIIVYDNDDDNDNNNGTTPSGGGGSNPKETSSPSGDPSENTSQPESHDQTPNNNTVEIPTISFPYVIEGTGIVVEQIGSYDGYFIEDGSDREVSGIAAIVLKNNGGNLRFVGVGISQGTRSLVFSGSMIPAGATVILQEQNGAAYSSSDPYYSATATTDLTDSFRMSEDLVTVKDNTKDGLTVTNISGKTLPVVKIYYKNYLPDENAYVGGITYCITLNDVEPETSTDVTASHYDSKYGMVMEVVVEQ